MTSAQALPVTGDRSEYSGRPPRKTDNPSDYLGRPPRKAPPPTHPSSPTAARYPPPRNDLSEYGRQRADVYDRPVCSNCSLTDQRYLIYSFIKPRVHTPEPILTPNSAHQHRARSTSFSGTGSVREIIFV